MATIEEGARHTKAKPRRVRPNKAVAKRVKKLRDTQAARLEYDRLAAIRAEASAEAQAPAIQRATVTTPVRKRQISVVTAEFGQTWIEEDDDTAPVVIREPIAEPDTKRGGYRRTDPLVAMNRRSHGTTVTHDHLRAVRRWRDDYEIGVAGAMPPRSVVGRVDGVTGQDAEYVWLAAAERYRAAVAAMGISLSGIVEALAIQGQTVIWVSRAIRQSPETTSGLLVAGLDLLADHYWPDRETRQTLIAKAMAKLQPLGFDFAVSAIGDVIPQERMGRGKITA